MGRFLCAPAPGLLPLAAAALLLPAALPFAPARAEGQVQLTCRGTLIESRGEAELLRTLHRLQFSLQLEAQGRSSDAALGQLQERLAGVRLGLQRLAVEDLRVTSPSTWTRTDAQGRPLGVQAQLQVSGRLAPDRLTSLIRQVGALPGVQLAPVDTRPDPAEAQTARRRLLNDAYQNALARAREIAATIGRRQLVPLEVQLGGSDAVPVLMMERMAAAPPPFRPEELPLPKDRTSMVVRFCAR